jgi:hypothetical protein
MDRKHRVDTGTRNDMIVTMAASIMESRMRQDEMIAEIMAQKGDTATAEILRNKAARIKAAIELIDEFGGCWT